MRSLSTSRSWILFSILFGGGFALDQISKAWAMTATPVSYNTGILFGIDLPLWLIYTISVVLLGLLAVAIIKLKLWSDPLRLTAAALVMAGGLGNMVDRLRLGYVVDFIDFYFWPTFNLADVWIVIGAFLLFFDFGFRGEELED